MITCPFIPQVWLECVDAVRDAGGEDVGTCSSVVRDLRLTGSVWPACGLWHKPTLSWCSPQQLPQLFIMSF